MALRDIELRFAWQVWHLWHWAGSGGALPFGAVGALAVGVAGVALGGIDRFCVAGVALMALDWLWWRAWFPFGAVGAVAVCVAGVALGDIDRQFAWQVGVAGVALRGIDRHFAWQVWHFATSTSTLRGRCGTSWHWDGSGGALRFPFGAVGAAAVGVAGRSTWRH